MLRKVPLIVILGSTGTGKTKLSLELAERFGGEIISADSMQVYANLDIATAKATKEEQSRAKHHLLDVATPNEPFTVVSFRNAALPIIENLLAQNKCPIVVGGTNYYIESLLWDILVSPKHANELDSMDKQSDIFYTVNTERAVGSEDVKDPLFLPQSEMLAMSSELLHNHLRKIDSQSANRIHPNNKRKIMRVVLTISDQRSHEASTPAYLNLVHQANTMVRHEEISAYFASLCCQTSSGGMWNIIGFKYAGVHSTSQEGSQSADSALTAEQAGSERVDNAYAAAEDSPIKLWGG